MKHKLDRGPTVLRHSFFRCLFYILLGFAAISSLPGKSRESSSQNTFAGAIGSPPREPVIFAPGVISAGDYESHPAFTPDGKTLYFLKDSPDFAWWTIFFSEFRDGRWTEPQVAPFSGQYRDADPFITPDGSKFLFISDRPAPGKAHRDLDIWIMDREGSAWGEPRNLGAPVNSDGSEWYPTLAADGTLYFGSNRPGGFGRTDLYRSRLVEGRYTDPENLGASINSDLDEFEPYIAPDQSFLIFMGENRERRGDFDLYIRRDSRRERDRFRELFVRGSSRPRRPIEE